VKEVSNRLDLEANDGVRGDREMSTCEMMETVRGAEYEIALAEERRRLSLERDLRSLLVLPSAGGPHAVTKAPLPAYCKAFAQLAARLGTAQPDSGAQPSEYDDQPPPKPSPVKTIAPTPPGDRPLAQPLQAVPLPNTSVARPAPRVTTWAEISSARDETKTSSSRADQYLVEVHKKWAISVACLVFALVGIPMALRFPRGGMGLVIGGGLAVFAIYYVGLIAGEGLGNKDIVHPWIAMWAPDIIFAVLGIYGMIQVGRESGSTRGGDLAELWDTLTSRFRRRKAA